MRTEEKIVTYRCDRCGKESSKRDVCIGIFQRRRILMAALIAPAIANNGLDPDLHKGYDLCDECRDSLARWLNEEE